MSNDPETGNPPKMTFFPIQLHREHRGPQRSRRLACSLTDSTRMRASRFERKTFLCYLRSLLFKRFENKIVRSPENTQSLAGLCELCGPLCPLCSFLPLYQTQTIIIHRLHRFTQIPIRSGCVPLPDEANASPSFICVNLYCNLWIKNSETEKTKFRQDGQDEQDVRNQAQAILLILLILSKKQP